MALFDTIPTRVIPAGSKSHITEELSSGRMDSPGLTTDEDFMNDVHLSTRVNATRTFLNAIDEIDISRDRGNLDDIELQIKKLEKEVLSDPNKTEQEKNEAQYTIGQLRSQQQSYLDRIAKNQSNIDRNKVDKEYVAKADQILDEENSNIVDWLKYDAPQDFGGSASEAGTQLALGLGPGFAKWGVKKIASIIAKDGVAGPLGAAAAGIELGIDAIGFAANAYGLYQMRRNETQAEKWDAVSARINQMEAEQRKANGGYELTQEQKDNIYIEAHKGLETVNDVNMGLMWSDAVQQVAMFAPWGKMIAKGIGMGKAMNIARKSVGLGVDVLSEGTEEGVQNLVSEKFKQGAYDKAAHNIGKTIGDVYDLSNESIKGIFGISDDPLTKTKEFRNSTRAGMIGGLSMGAGVEAFELVKDKSVNTYYRRNKPEDINYMSSKKLKQQVVNDFTSGLEKDELETKTELAQKYHIAGKKKEFFKAIDELEKQPDNGLINKESLAESKKLYEDVFAAYEFVDNKLPNVIAPQKAKIAAQLVSKKQDITTSTEKLNKLIENRDAILNKAIRNPNTLLVDLPDGNTTTIYGDAKENSILENRLKVISDKRSVLNTRIREAMAQRAVPTNSVYQNIIADHALESANQYASFLDREEQQTRDAVQMQRAKLASEAYKIGYTPIPGKPLIKATPLLEDHELQNNEASILDAKFNAEKAAKDYANYQKNPVLLKTMAQAQQEHVEEKVSDENSKKKTDKVKDPDINKDVVEENDTVDLQPLEGLEHGVTKGIVKGYTADKKNLVIQPTDEEGNELPDTDVVLHPVEYAKISKKHIEDVAAIDPITYAETPVAGYSDREGTKEAPTVKRSGTKSIAHSLAYVFQSEDTVNGKSKPKFDTTSKEIDTFLTNITNEDLKQVIATFFISINKEGLTADQKKLPDFIKNELLSLIKGKPTEEQIIEFLNRPINTSNFNKPWSGVAHLTNEKAIVADFIPLSVKLSDGKTTVAEDGKLYYHDSDFSFISYPEDVTTKQQKIDYAKKQFTKARNNRLDILTRILLKQKTEVSGLQKGVGHINNTNERGSISEMMELSVSDVELAIANVNDNFRTSKEKSGVVTFANGQRGTIGLITTNTANGDKTLVKVDPSKLTAEHADILFDAIVQKYAYNSARHNQKFIDKSATPRVEGDLTCGDIIDFLALCGEVRTSLDYKDNAKLLGKHMADKQLYVTLDKAGHWVLRFGKEGVMNLYHSSPEGFAKGKAAFIDWATKNKNYAVILEDKKLGIQLNGLCTRQFRIGSLSTIPKQEGQLVSYKSVLLEQPLNGKGTTMITTDVKNVPGTNSITGAPAVFFPSELEMILPPRKDKKKASPKKGTTKTKDTTTTATPVKVRTKNVVKNNMSFTILTDTNVDKLFEHVSSLSAGTRIYKVSIKDELADEEISEYTANDYDYSKALDSGLYAVVGEYVGNKKKRVYFKDKEGYNTALRKALDREIGSIKEGVDKLMLAEPIEEAVNPIEDIQEKNKLDLFYNLFTVNRLGVYEILLRPSGILLQVSTNAIKEWYFDVRTPRVYKNTGAHITDSVRQMTDFRYDTTTIRFTKDDIGKNNAISAALLYLKENTNLIQTNEKASTQEVAKQEDVIDLSGANMTDATDVNPEYEFTEEEISSEELTPEEVIVTKESPTEESNTKTTADKDINASFEEFFNGNGVSNDITEDDLKGLKLREAMFTTTTPGDVNKAKQWLADKLGSKATVRIHNGIIDIVSKGKRAFGVFTRDAIILSSEMAPGTEYHEAYHRVSNLYLTEDEQKEINRQVVVQYKDILVSRFGKKNKYKQSEIDEVAADMFMMYVMSNEKTNSIVDKIKSIFKELLNFIKHYILKIKPLSKLEIDSLFQAITDGKYKYSNPIPSRYNKMGKSTLFRIVEVDGINTAAQYKELKDSLKAVLLHVNKVNSIKSVENINTKSVMLFLQKHVERLNELKNNAANDAIKNAYAAQIQIINSVLNVKTFPAIMAEVNLELKALKISALESDNEYLEEVESAIGDIKHYDKKSYETNAKDNVRSAVKIMLATLPASNKASLLTGLPLVVDFNRFWNKLIADIHKSNTIEEAIATLEEKGSTNFTYAILAKQLNNANQDIKTQFLRSVRLHAHEFMHFLYNIDPKTGTIDGQYTSAFLNQERMRLVKQDGGLWQEAFLRSNLVENGKISDIEYTALLDKWNKLKDVAVADRKKNKRITNTDVLLNGISEILNSIGISIDNDTLKKYFDTEYPSDVIGDAADKFIREEMSNVIGYDSSIGKFKRGAENKSGVMKEVTIKNLLYNEKTVSQLAQAHIESHDQRSNMIVGPDGNSFYRMSENNFITSMTDELNEDPSLVDTIANCDGNRNSIILKKIKNGSKVKVTTVSAFAERKANDSGREYTEINDIEDYVLKLSAIFQNVLPFPVMADKKTYYMLEGISRIPVRLSFDNKGNITLNDELIRVFQGYLVDEMERIEKTEKEWDLNIKDSPQELTENLHYVNKKDEHGVIRKVKANGFKWNLFTSLNDIKEANNPNTRQDYIRANSRQLVENILISRIEQEVRQAIELGVIAEEKEKYVNKFIPTSIVNKYAAESEYGNEQRAIKHIIADNAVNTMMSIIEIQKVFSGSPMLYKAGKTGSFEELVKRLSGLLSTGSELRSEIPGESVAVNSPTYNVASCYSNKAVSAFMIDMVDKYVELLAKTHKITEAEARTAFGDTINNILFPFTKIDNTDAQAFISHEMWLILAKKLGNWDSMSDIDKEAYKWLSDPNYEASLEVQKAAMHLAGQPMKMVHFGHKYKDNTDTVIYDKMSMATLWPRIVQGMQIEQLSKRMIDSEKPIHMLKFDTATKAGNQERSFFYANGNNKDTIDFNGLTVYNQEFKYLREQLNTEAHDVDRTKTGTQVIKVILSNVLYGETYTLEDGRQISGSELVQGIYNSLATLSNKGREKVLAKYGATEDNLQAQTNAIYGILRAEAIKGNMGSDLVDALSIDKTTGKPKVHLDSFVNKDWMFSRLFSNIVKDTVDINLPGKPMIQHSNVGFRQVSETPIRTLHLTEAERAKYSPLALWTRENTTDLNFYEFTKGGKTKAMEAMVSISLFKSAIPDYDNKTFEEKVDYVRNNLDTTEFIGYRIPTQSQSSVLCCKAVSFIPDYDGDVIILPTELTGLTGSDFDIDKMYSMRYNYDIVTDENGNTTSVKSKYYVKSKREVEISNLDDTDELKQELLSIPEFVDKLDLRVEEIIANNIDRISSNLGLGSNKELKKALNVLAKVRDTSNQVVAQLNTQLKLAYDELNSTTDLKQIAEIQANIETINEAIRQEEDYSSQVRSNIRNLKDTNKTVYNYLVDHLKELKIYPNVFEFNKLSEEEQNTKNAVENNLVDSFRGLLLHGDNAMSILTPLGLLTSKIQDYASTIEAKVNYKDLEYYIPTTQTKIKKAYIDGKTGVGPAALNNAHHALAQTSKLSVTLDDVHNKGILNILADKGVISFHEETGKDGVRISEWLSALIDSFVDIAKDPYITKVNVNQTTYNAVYFLLRAGYGFDTFKFISQPILKEYAALKKASKGKLISINKKKSVSKLVQEKYSKLLSSEEQATIKDMTIEEALSADRSNSSEHAKAQLKIFAEFENINDYAEELSNIVHASQIDTKKFGTSINTTLAFKNKIRKVQSYTSWKGVDRLLALDNDLNKANIVGETHLASLYDNSISLIDKIMRGHVVSTSRDYEQTMVNLLELTGNSLSTDEDLIKVFNKSIDTQIAAKFFFDKEYCGITQETVKSLFYGENSIVNRFIRIQNGEFGNYSKNILFDKSLFVPYIPEDKTLPSFLERAVTRDEDGINAEHYQNSFDDLMKSDSEYVRDFAKALIVYDFVTSGYKRNMQSISDIISISARNDFSLNNSITYNEYREQVVNSALVDDKLKYQVIKNLSSNIDVVGECTSDDISATIYALDKTYKQFISVNPSSRVKSKNGMQRPIRIGANATNDIFMPYIKYEGRLYQLYGNKEYTTSKGVLVQQPIYKAINTTGYYDKGHTIVENTFDKSIVDSNNLTPSNSVMKSLIGTGRFIKANELNMNINGEPRVITEEDTKPKLVDKLKEITPEQVEQANKKEIGC